ncbi:hypothetical protein KDAU_70730 [Dictyobacter aurantiacus]|uniref:Uncharacterized protein n=1 Tax=Dictyobacter aurantiacus TaxID=1936993 RepID=A0A401ZSI8_9CHLR|nr:hypothetical protein KDAU_70730 [Dictyobacter aurantiacus]
MKTVYLLFYHKKEGMFTMDEGPGSPFQPCSKRCVSSDTIKSEMYRSGMSESLCSVADLSREEYALRM